MARIKDSSVEAVKAAAEILPVVEARTHLRKVGARYTGRCPFHDERTPSFSVNAADKVFYCFGCGKGGDLIKFVQETESVDFVGAIEWLADRFNVPLEYDESAPGEEMRRQRRKRLYELLEAAAAFYERYLWESPAADRAHDHLAGRALREPIAREFRLGYAPGGTTLARKAGERGFTREELEAAGLLTRRGSDYFSGRLLFPLADAGGRIRGFQARRLREDDPLKAKFVNSPEGELFRKGDLLYGLHQAREAIQKQERAVVVEGNADVLALRQAGVEPVVASMGTALTESQLKELRRRTQRLWLCFDGDAAGEAATLRGMELATAQGFEVKVVTLPPGLDPADLADRFEQHLAKAETYLAYRVRLEIDRAEDRNHAYLRVQDVLNGVPESPERQDAWRYANDRLGITVQLRASARVAGGSANASSKAMLDAGPRAEAAALLGVVAHPNLRPILEELGPEHFDVELHREARDYILNGGELEGELAAVIAVLDARAAEEDLDERAAEVSLLLLRERQLRRELQSASTEKIVELQGALVKLRDAVAALT